MRALGHLAMRKGDLKGAENQLQMAMEMYQRIGSWRDEAVMKAMFAMVRMEEGRPGEALALMASALDFFESHQLTSDVNVTQNILRQFKGQLGDEFEALWMKAAGRAVPTWLETPAEPAIPPELLEILERLREMSPAELTRYLNERPELLKMLVELGIVRTSDH